MTTNGRRLDRIEEAFRPGADPSMPSHWEITEEIRKMEANPGYQSKWSQERVNHWISELKAQGDETYQP